MISLINPKKIDFKEDEYKDIEVNVHHSNGDIAIQTKVMMSESRYKLLLLQEKILKTTNISRIQLNKLEELTEEYLAIESFNYN